MYCYNIIFFCMKIRRPKLCSPCPSGTRSGRPLLHASLRERMHVPAGVDEHDGGQGLGVRPGEARQPRDALHRSVHERRRHLAGGLERMQLLAGVDEHEGGQGLNAALLVDLVLRRGLEPPPPRGAAEARRARGASPPATTTPRRSASPPPPARPPHPQN